MGFFDKLKGAVSAVTGGAAKVQIQTSAPLAMPGDQLGVRVTATSTGGDVKFSGVFVDLQGVEVVRLRRGSVPNVDHEIHKSERLKEQQYQIAGDGVIPAGQTVTFDGAINIPGDAQPTFDGVLCDHSWGIRGRIATFGNDPDSGFQPVRIGLRA